MAAAKKQFWIACLSLLPPLNFTTMIPRKLMTAESAMTEIIKILRKWDEKMTKLKYKLIPQGAAKGRVPINLIFMDKKDIVAAGLTYREACNTTFRWLNISATKSSLCTWASALKKHLPSSSLPTLDTRILKPCWKLSLCLT